MKNKQEVVLEVGQVWRGKTPKGNPQTRTITGIGHLSSMMNEPVDAPHVLTGRREHVRYEHDGKPNAWAEYQSFARRRISEACPLFNGGGK